MGLVQRAIEAQGIPTVSLSVRRGLSAGTHPSRVLLTPFPSGQTVGPPGDAAMQRVVLRQALTLLSTAASEVMVPFSEP